MSPVAGLLTRLCTSQQAFTTELVLSHPLLTMHQAVCTCLQFAAAVESHAHLTDSLEDTHQGMLTVDSTAPAVAMETDKACIDLTENDDMDVAPATGQFACGCVHCFFLSPNACCFCSYPVCLWLCSLLLS